MRRAVRQFSAGALNYIRQRAPQRASRDTRRNGCIYQCICREKCINNILRFKFSGTDRRGCCGVFVCHGSHPVSHFDLRTICKATMIMARNTFHKKVMQENTYNGVFVCHGSQTVSHFSNIGRVVLRDNLQRDNNHAKEYIPKKGYSSLHITIFRVAYNTMQGCISFT